MLGVRQRTSVNGFLGLNVPQRTERQEGFLYLFFKGNIQVFIRR